MQVGTGSVHEAGAECQVGEILVVGAGGITTVYANDGGVVVAY